MRSLSAKEEEEDDEYDEDEAFEEKIDGVVVDPDKVKAFNVSLN